METDKVSLIAVNQRIHSLLGHSRVNHKVPEVREWEKREVSPDAVRAWIRQSKVSEPAIMDLEIVVGVTPTTNAGGRIIEEIRVVKVMSV